MKSLSRLTPSTTYLEAIEQQLAAASESTDTLAIVFTDAEMDDSVVPMMRRLPAVVVRVSDDTDTLDGPIINTLRYAASHCGVRHVIVSGHTRCSAVRRALTAYQQPIDGNSPSWLHQARLAQRRLALAKQHLVQQLETLSWNLHPRVNEPCSSLCIHGLLYLAESGAFLNYDFASREFQLLNNQFNVA